MVNKWELKGKLISSKSRRKFLRELSKGTKTPNELRVSLKMHMSHVSRTLRDLEKLKLIECLTPRLRKGKQYRITRLGKDILRGV